MSLNSDDDDGDVISKSPYQFQRLTTELDSEEFALSSGSSSSSSIPNFSVPSNGSESIPFSSPKYAPSIANTITTTATATAAANAPVFPVGVSIFNLPPDITKKQLVDLIDDITSDGVISGQPLDIQIFKSSGSAACWCTITLSDYTSVTFLVSTLNGYTFNGFILQCFPLQQQQQQQQPQQQQQQQLPYYYNTPAATTATQSPTALPPTYYVSPPVPTSPPYPYVSQPYPYYPPYIQEPHLRRTNSERKYQRKTYRNLKDSRYRSISEQQDKPPTYEQQLASFQPLPPPQSYPSHPHRSHPSLPPQPPHIHSSSSPSPQPNNYHRRAQRTAAFVPYNPYVLNNPAYGYPNYGYRPRPYVGQPGSPSVGSSGSSGSSGSLGSYGSYGSYPSYPSYPSYGSYPSYTSYPSYGAYNSYRSYGSFGSVESSDSEEEPDDADLTTEQLMVYNPQKHVDPTRLFIGNVPFDSTFENLWSFFHDPQTDGELKSLVMQRQINGNFKGFAIGFTGSLGESVGLIKRFNGKDFEGRNLIVRFDKSPKQIMKSHNLKKKTKGRKHEQPGKSSDPTERSD